MAKRLLGAAAATAAAAALCYLNARRRRKREAAAVAAALQGPVPEGAIALATFQYARRAWWRALPPFDYSVTTVAALADGADATLDGNGAALARFAALDDEAVDATDAETCATVLFPAAERLLVETTGCARAVCFDHIARAAVGATVDLGGRDAKRLGPIRASGASGPINIVHNDYSIASGRPRIRNLLRPFVADPGALEAVLAGRCSIVNVWCPLGDVASDPLAFVDWPSLRPRDLRVRRVAYDTGRVGETTGVYDSATHAWRYFPGMARGTAMLLKTWDSRPGPGEAPRSLYAAHASAALAGVDAAATPRRSVEMRCLLLYDAAAAADDFFARPFVAPHIARVRSGASFYEKVRRVTYFDEDPDAWVPPEAGAFTI